MVNIKIRDFDHHDARREYIDFWTELAPHVKTTVIASFGSEVGKMDTISKAEIKDRIDFLTRLVNEARFDLKWSKARIRDYLPTLLRMKLAGIAIDLQALSRHSTW